MRARQALLANYPASLTGCPVLVTGAAGFIGSHTCLALKGLGALVTAVDNFSDLLGQRTLKKRRAALLAEAGVEIHEVDLQIDDLAWVTGNQLVFHFAGLPGLESSWSWPEQYFRANVLATVRLAHQLRSTQSKSHLVHISTSSVYGPFATGDENSQLNPASPYGVSKLAAELALTNLLQGVEVSCSVLRYFSVYGPGQRPDMAYARFIRTLGSGGSISVTGTGTQSRTNTYITDVVALTIELGLTREVGVFNVGGSSLITVNEALEKLIEISGVSPQVMSIDRPEGDQEITRADTTRLQTVLGPRDFTCPTEGLAKQYTAARSYDESTNLFGYPLKEYIRQWGPE